MHADYHPPTVLTALSGVFLILGAICVVVVAGDILWRRGWKSMMWIMIPVYPINAAYMMPVTLYVYFKYGRAPKPTPRSRTVPDNHSSSTHGHTAVREKEQACHDAPRVESGASQDPHSTSHTSDSDIEKAGADSTSHPNPSGHCCHSDDSRPMWATLLVGVSHCGAGCVLGDLVGEWLVYGTGAAINGHSIWAELLIDYAFALLFGIAFQYFSIAPMSGEWGPKTVWRAAKADILSLTSFEVGAFGWMVIYQVGIFGYRLSINTWTYWWMMQIGMALGFATAMPVNYFLITKGIKEPCA